MKDNIGEVIKKLRLKRQLTLKEVAKRADLSISFLSQVERGKSSITLQSLSRIAEAFDVSRSYFFNNHTAKSDVYKNKGNDLNFKDSYFIYQSLTGNMNTPLFEPMLVILLHNEEKEMPSSHSGQEFVYVMDGTLTLVIQDEETLLEAGNSFHIDSSIPHTWFNNSKKPVKLLYVYADY
ncbi:helix-turn-helix domain-containing protein [Virgibacillus sp. W0181]|uniref:helix-turn-helix domain-containing protein n=1 Tax=Virgibacillus sp. W0181 TaxID=3391581 RepID=UPI003F4754C7